MGTCCSRQSTESADERTRLLSTSSSTATVDQAATFEATPGMTTEAPQTSEARHEEKLKTVVQSTAEKLIDISAIRMLDRLQPTVVNEREGIYT
ncbi:hypothetical protein BC831DRAFT_444518 [Entophlyctis helioformis]|nr:hypothetical protein BC831DRAFT_444518 [Entophlyctis helioformis]